MATLSTLANGTVIDDTETYDKYTGTGVITVSLPQITAGGGGSADDAPGDSHTVCCESTGTVIVLDYNGRRAGIVGPYQTVQFRALNTNQDWVTCPVPTVFQLNAVTDIAAGAATPTLGTAAPIVAGAPTGYMLVRGKDGVDRIALLWTKA